MTRSAALFLLCAACAAPPDARRTTEEPSGRVPEIARQVAPPSWQLVNYVGGLVIPVPARAEVARPPGIDSAILEIRGAGFTFDADDYGAFDGPVNATVDGRRANVERERSPACEHLIVRVELDTPSNMHVCDPDGKNCRAAPGVARLNGHCTPGPGCRTLEAMISGARFVPRPYPPFRTEEGDFKPAPPACRMPDER